MMRRYRRLDWQVEDSGRMHDNRKRQVWRRWREVQCRTVRGLRHSATKTENDDDDFNSSHVRSSKMMAVINQSIDQSINQNYLKWPVQRVYYKLCATVHRCLQYKAPPYLADLCIPVSDIASRQHLRSASSNQLVVPRHRRTQFGRRAFSVGGPMVWNALPDSIRDTALSTCSFRRHLKTLFFSFY